MQLLQDDYLGGNGSRGYGRVKFDVQEVKRKTAADYRENRLAESVDFEVPPTLKA
jgi:CRISPR-associated protein Csm3